jgi:DNA-binding transcriptional MerR regulator
MRSGEVARLAGVSVRTLRHYHQVGVLPEPERGSNGYREYDVHDVVRLLRVRRLAALGIALERMPSILDESDAGSDTLLDDLDAELAGQVERLTRQREMLASLRAHRAFLDLPPELARFQAAFEAAGLSREMARIDRDQSLLLAQVAGEEAMTDLSRIYERLTAPDIVGELTAAMDVLGALHADAALEEVQAVSHRLGAVLAPFVSEIASPVPPFDSRAVGLLLGAHSDAVLNEGQRRALALLEEQLTGTDG